MKEKKPSRPKSEKKSPKEETSKNKQAIKAIKPKTKPLPISKQEPAIQHPPTNEEIEDMKEDILTYALLNPYALGLYDYMCKSSYETNVQVVLSMRETWIKLTKLNQIIADELKGEQQD